MVAMAARTTRQRSSSKWSRKDISFSSDIFKKMEATQSEF
jgi:hypothetical protein